MKAQLGLFMDLLPSFRDLFLAQNAFALQATQAQSELLPRAVANIIWSTKEFKKLAAISPLERKAEGIVSRYLSGKSLLTKDDLGRLDTIFGRIREVGTTSIRGFAEDVAAARGLRLTDTPIGEPTLQQLREFESDLGSSRAQAELGIEAQRAQFAEALRQFQVNLRASAVANRASLMSGFIPGFRGGGTAGGTMPTVGSADTGGAFGFLSSLTGERGALARAGIGRETALDVANIGAGATTEAARIGAAGRSPGALDYIAAIGSILSTARVKRAIAPLNPDEYDAALARVRATPIVRYRYRWEPDQGPPHIGPILELAPPEITDDGVRVNLLDYTGLQHAALKAVDRRVDRLERRLAAPVRRATPVGRGRLAP